MRYKIFGALAIAAICGTLIGEANMRATAGTPVDQGASGVQDWPIATAARYGGVDCRINVSSTIPTQMTCGKLTGVRKALSIQNNGANTLNCGFNGDGGATTYGIFVPPVASSVPGSWSGDVGIGLHVFCLAATADQTSPANSGIIEVQ